MPDRHRFRNRDQEPENRDKSKTKREVQRLREQKDQRLREQVAQRQREQVAQRQRELSAAQIPRQRLRETFRFEVRQKEKRRLRDMLLPRHRRELIEEKLSSFLGLPLSRQAAREESLESMGERFYESFAQIANRAQAELRQEEVRHGRATISRGPV
jgi:hypothetical protein